MKICILTPRFPFPENGGDVLRINNIARYLKTRGHSLVLVSLATECNPDIDSARQLYDGVYVKQHHRIHSFVHSAIHMLKGKPMQCGYYYLLAYRRLLRNVIAKEAPDLYISHLLRMTPYLEYFGLQDKSIVEMTDALSKTYSLSSGAKGMSIKKIVYGIEKKLISRYEQKVIRTFPKVVLVSDADVEYLSQRASSGNVQSSSWAAARGSSLAMHTNGIDCMERVSQTYNTEKICFVGNMRTLQNQDAVLYFINDIFPLIKQRIPAAKFYIVGAQPPQKIRSLASDDIIVTGFVDNLEATISDSALAVAPVRVAAGIQNKVLVAMGCGLPVVMTSLISRAIPELSNSHNCFISDDASSFALSCVNLMTNRSMRDAMGAKGYDMVSMHYSWSETLNGYEQIL